MSTSGDMAWLRISMLLMLVATVLSAASPGPPLQLAVVNQVRYHLEVVAGALNVLRNFSSAPVTVYLHEDSIKQDQLGFQPWMAPQQGVVWKAMQEYNGSTVYDLVWYISPEYNVWDMQKVNSQMQPKVSVFMLHNGHIRQETLDKLLEMASGGPVYTLGPHVAKFISKRTKSQAEWLLPIMPYRPFKPCQLEDMQGGLPCLKGFSIQGKLEYNRRNYTALWHQIQETRHKQGELPNFGLKIMGASASPGAAAAGHGSFLVPDEIKDLVSVHTSPPYHTFYDMVHHSRGLVPLLAGQQYYHSKFTSTIITSLVTGVPIVATQQLLDAYSFLTPESVYLQAAAETEVDAMLRLTDRKLEDTWKVRDACTAVRSAVNCRAQQLIHKALLGKGLVPDAKSSIAATGLCTAPSTADGVPANTAEPVPAVADSSDHSAGSVGGSSSSSDVTSQEQGQSAVQPTIYRRLMASYQ